MSTDPRLAVALKYQHAGLVDEAWSAIADVVADPAAPASVLELGLTLRQAAGAYADIVSLAQRLVTDAPSRADIWALLADAQEHLGQPLAAIAAYEEAVALVPQHPHYSGNLAALYMGQGRFAAAARLLDQVLSIDPNHVPALINVGVCHIECGRVQRGLASLARAQELDPTNRAAADNALFAMHNLATTPSELFNAHMAWASKTPSPSHAAAQISPAGRKLRIGYVSPDFRQHSVAYFVEPLLRAYDRDVFEVYCYANVPHADDVTQRFRASADGWRDIAGLATADVVDLIKSDDIDILIDLAGHTQGHGLDVFAARPAQIQITAIGYPGTTGSRAFDGRIADAWSDPPEHDAFSTEPVLRVPGGMHCYAATARAPDVTSLPCISGQPFTFGSFNKLAKITGQTLELWAKVLSAVPHARLLVKSKPLSEVETRSEFAERCARAGIAPGRLDLQGWNPNDQDHLGLYGSVDIALDTTPYNGTTTTCEALWMGVPVITLIGQTHAARVGYSLLNSVGLSNFACATEGDFISTAQTWAQDRAALAALRQTLRERVAQSRLCDDRAYVREVEALFRSLAAAR